MSKNNSNEKNLTGIDKSLMRKGIVLCLAAAISYAVLYYMSSISVIPFYGKYMGGMPASYKIKRVLFCTLAGIALCVIPWERIYNRVIRKTASDKNLHDVRNKSVVPANVIILIVLYMVICALSGVWDVLTRPPYGSGYSGEVFAIFKTNSDRIFCAIITMLAFFLIMNGIDFIKNKWCAFFNWAIIMTTNVLCSSVVSSRVVQLAAIICADTIVYIVYAFARKKIKLGTLVASIIIGVIWMCIYGANLFDSKLKLAGSVLMAEKEATGVPPRGLHGKDYMMSIVYNQQGIIGVLIVVTAFILFIIAAVVGVKSLMGKSSKRAVFVMGLSIMFITIIVCMVLGDLGILAPADAYVLSDEVYIPLLFFSFRMFIFCDTKRKSRQFFNQTE